MVSLQFFQEAVSIAASLIVIFPLFLQAPAPPVSADPWGAMREAGPVTSAVGTIGMKKAEIKAGLREVTLCKDGDGMIGLRVEDINNGIFICFVQAKSPAALAGLR